MIVETTVDKFAATIVAELQKYKDIAGDEVKEIVRTVGKQVRKEISQTAPTKTGTYKKSWRVKVINEDSQKLILVVHSKTRYMLTHLLEDGHVLLDWRTGKSLGRVEGRPHIKVAEEHGNKMLEEEIRKALAAK